MGNNHFKIMLHGNWFMTFYRSCLVPMMILPTWWSWLRIQLRQLRFGTLAIPLAGQNLQLYIYVEHLEVTLWSLLIRWWSSWISLDSGVTHVSMFPISVCAIRPIHSKDLNTLAGRTLSVLWIGEGRVS